MTETEWLAGTDLTAMLGFHGDKLSDRKRRLFACACCRTVWHLLADARSRAAVEVAERFAEGTCGLKELTRAERAAARAVTKRERAAEACFNNAPDGPEDRTSRWPGPVKEVGAEFMLLEAQREAAAAARGGADCIVIWEATEYRAAWATAEEQLIAVTNISERHVSQDEYFKTQSDLWKKRRETHAAILREIAGNPFRPVESSPAWQTPTVLGLAQAALDSRTLPSGWLDNLRLAVLADALEEAGCTNADVLDHCRSEGPHVRGCWVVDLLLDKT